MTRCCRCCGEVLRGWRCREGRWEPLGIDGFLHACDSREFRNWKAREWRRERRRALEKEREAIARREPWRIRPYPPNGIAASMPLGVRAAGSGVK